MNTLEQQWETLGSILKDVAVNNTIAVAFSGGVDSRFLAHAISGWGLTPVLLHVNGPHIPQRESQEAAQWAETRNFLFTSLKADPLHLPQVRYNDRRRCYHCKQALFTQLLQEAGPLPLCDGTHASDSQGYRPGMQALQELGIHSPLARANLSKPHIRALAKQTGMDRFDQKARPCMLTRLQYGLEAKPQLLLALDAGEQVVEETFAALLSPELVPDFRLRMIEEDSMELHVQDGPWRDARFPQDTEQNGPLVVSGEISAPLVKTLNEAIYKASGRHVNHIRLLPTLSGYFDTLSR